MIRETVVLNILTPMFLPHKAYPKINVRILSIANIYIFKKAGIYIKYGDINPMFKQASPVSLSHTAVR